MLEKARALPCDVVVLDLEDAVAPEMKEAARAQVCAAVGNYSGRETVVRLNPLLTIPIRDVNDIAVAQTAILGEADILCSREVDFYDDAMQRFFAKSGIAVIGDIDLIRKLRE